MSRSPVAQARWPLAEKDCPLRATHTSGPNGYVDWHEWAPEQAKTHVQKQCPGCGLWMIWEPRPTSTPAPAVRRAQPKNPGAGAS